MPTLKFTSNYLIQRNNSVSISDIENNELFVIGFKDNSGKRMSDKSVQALIDAAKTQVESMLSIKLQKQVIKEQKNFRLTNLSRNRFVALTYPFEQGVSIQAQINDVSIVKYGPDTMVSTRSNGGNDIFRRNVHILPSSKGFETESQSAPFSLNLAQFYDNNLSNGYGYTLESLPAGWEIAYITPGYGNDPMIKEYIRKTVAMKALGVLSEAQSVAGVGVAQRTLSVDGLNSTVETTSSATNSTYGAYILQLRKELENLKSALRGKYLGTRVIKM